MSNVIKSIIKISGDTINSLIDTGSDVISTTIDVTTINVQADLTGYLQNVVEDTTPQLGGNLDLNSNDVNGTGDLNITGTITTSGNVNSRDMSADGTKLDGIESGATADQSDSEIETAYNNQVGQVSAGEITAGTETGIRRYSPADVKSFVDTHGGGGGDNLGDHTMTENLQTNGNWISNDGGNEGIYIQPDGEVSIGTTSAYGLFDNKLFISGNGFNSATRTSVVIQNTSSTSASTLRCANSDGGYGGLQCSGSGYNFLPNYVVFTASSGLGMLFNTDSNVISGGTNKIEFRAGGYNANNQFEVNPNGSLKVPDYGSASHTGTLAYLLGVDASGNVIEEKETSGVASGTTDVSGDLTITHGFGGTPTVAVVTAQGTTPYVCTVHTIGATTFKVRVSDTGGSAVTSTAVDIHYICK